MMTVMPKIAFVGAGSTNFVTESSEHSPWFSKDGREDPIERFNIPLDEYARRCEAQIAAWDAMREQLVNVQGLTVEAALTGRRDAIYQAANLDPHTGAELSLDEIHFLVDDLLEAHEHWTA